MVDQILKLLEYYNDPNFKFNPKYHKYTYDNEDYISVTQFVSKFHEKFDSNYWSKKKSEECGINQEELLYEWKKINERSTEIGTATHNWIENYFNKLYQELPTDLDIIDRINKFNYIYATHLYKLIPIKFEQRIFSKKWKIAGTFDSLFLYNNNIIIIDYKTNKEFIDDNHYKGKYQKLLDPFNNYYKNHLNEYSIQVSLYKLILSEIGINVKQSYLLHIGPQTEAKMYKAYDFSDLLLKYLEKNN